MRQGDAQSPGQTSKLLRKVIAQVLADLDATIASVLRWASKPRIERQCRGRLMTMRDARIKFADGSHLTRKQARAHCAVLLEVKTMIVFSQQK